MKILDRYLQAVAFWLPDKQKQDITAELSEEIRSQVEEREEALGRPLHEAELETMLKTWGSPLIVAESYLPRHYLIGPAVFPIYALVLKRALTYSFLPWVAVWLLLSIFSPDFRAEHPGASVGEALETIWLAAVNIFAFLTVGFVILDRVNARSKFLEQWNPKQLPAPRDPLKISRGAAINEAVWGMVALAWLLSWSGPNILFMRITPGHSVFYWPVVGLQAAAIALACANSVHPYWTKARSVMSLLINAYGVLLAGLLMGSGPWLEVPSAGPSAATLVSSLNISCLVALIVTALIYLVRSFWDVRRLLRNKPAPSGALTTTAVC